MLKNFISKYPAKYVFPVFGLVSGIVSGSILSLVLAPPMPGGPLGILINSLKLEPSFWFSPFLILFIFLPGLFFGFLTTLFLTKYLKGQKSAWWKVPVWFFLTMLSWLIISAMHLLWGEDTLIPEITGSILVVLAFNCMFVRLSFRFILYLVTSIIVGVALVFLSNLVYDTMKVENFSLIPAFIIWQTGITFVFGWILDYAKIGNGY